VWDSFIDAASLVKRIIDSQSLNKRIRAMWLIAHGEEEKEKWRSPTPGEQEFITWAPRFGKWGIEKGKILSRGGFDPKEPPRRQSAGTVLRAGG